MATPTQLDDDDCVTRSTQGRDQSGKPEPTPSSATALRCLQRLGGDPQSGSMGWLMGPDYNYFERGNLDIFSGRGRCMDGPVCAMNLTSDGSGPHHGWYCNYVEVTMTGVHTPCSKVQFTVEQWLALDAPPYDLTAVRNNCPSEYPDGRRLRKPISSV
ncbi:Late embryoproteinsis abundant hydroxyproline-rich glycoprotein family, putative isoform 1 [Hibiscus syriacus]|uniref:Late embryoproteinsis abundant hydroxyproline-rich glycoprotein family, putative isoform 1 n=1 Tax=Hibiscus syriacus TaxID=106335 RepID=A0A6A3ASU6_HIBSY|nr:Late embryoproteinsis abundant hydroxyproline-rich glycoprotein family, putative isoform 1 [Hibiscus syriacus]